MQEALTAALDSICWSERLSFTKHTLLRVAQARVRCVHASTLQFSRAAVNGDKPTTVKLIDPAAGGKGIRTGSSSPCFYVSQWGLAAAGSLC